MTVSLSPDQAEDLYIPAALSVYSALEDEFEELGAKTEAKTIYIANILFSGHIQHGADEKKSNVRLNYRVQSGVGLRGRAGLDGKYNEDLLRIVAYAFATFKDWLISTYGSDVKVCTDVIVDIEYSTNPFGDDFWESNSEYSYNGMQYKPFRASLSDPFEEF